MRPGLELLHGSTGFCEDSGSAALLDARHTPRPFPLPIQPSLVDFSPHFANVTGKRGFRCGCLIRVRNKLSWHTSFARVTTEFLRLE
jgi:hypothetical protein